MGLQRDDWAGPKIGNAYTQCRSRGQASGLACQSISYQNRRTNSEGNVKVVGRWFHQAHLAPAMAIQYCASKEEKWADKMLCGLQKP